MADSGHEAIQLAKDKKPKVIFCDLHMPGMNGFEVVKKLREDDATKNIFIVAQTADVFEETKRKCLAAGFDECVSKPLSSDKILKVLEEKKIKIT